MKTILFITLTLFSGFVNAWDLSAQAALGRCSSAIYMQMCAEGRNVWRVSGQARHGISDHFNVAADLIHYSSWDGAADLQGDEDQQTGMVNFEGLGIEYAHGSLHVGAQYGFVQDPVGMFYGQTHYVYLSFERPISDSLSASVVVDRLGEFGYVGAGFSWRF